MENSLDVKKKTRGRKIVTISSIDIKGIEKLVSSYEAKFDGGSEEKETVNYKGKTKRKINTGKLDNIIIEESPDVICADPNQPRKYFNDPRFFELVESVRERGVQTPIIVVEISNSSRYKYMLIAGERRWRAAKKADRETIPMIIRKGLKNKKERHFFETIENFHREGLIPLEQALAIRRTMVDFNLTLKDTARELKIDYTMAHQRYQFLKLDIEVLSKMEPFLPKKECISQIVARELAKVPNKKLQVEWANKILKEKMLRNVANNFIWKEARKAGYTIGARHKPADVHSNLRSFANRTIKSVDIFLEKGVDIKILFVNRRDSKADSYAMKAMLAEAAEKLQTLGNRCIID